jgi:alpha-2-macroglobulin
MRARNVAVLALILLSIPVLAREKKIYFSVTTNKTFRPNEKPKIQLYAHDVDALEFRVYKVKDPLKFFQQLDDVHQFGPQYSPPEHVDERTWLERFHDWKMSLWHSIRNFFRGQYSAEARAEIRERHSQGGQRTGITGATGFAAVPVLNSQQLVARWKLDLPPRYVSESSDLPMDSLPSGTYVVEATDGTYRAYTVLLVSRMVLVTKTSNGRVFAFTADRDKGEFVAESLVSTWHHKKQAAQFKTDDKGIGEAKVEPATSTERETPSDYGSEWVLAQHGDDVALVAPYMLNLSSDPNQDWRGYIYTDRPVYRPGDTVQFKAILRRQDGDRLLLPSERELQVKVEDAAHNTILQKSYSLSPFGSLSGSVVLPATAPLGYYSITLPRGFNVGSFQVEEYKKPDYFVKVTPESPRTLQGNDFKATIEARYYFGEPVANAKVKYVVHTQRSYYFGEDEEEEPEAPSTSGGGDEGGPANDNGYFFGEQILEEEGKLDANGRLVVTIPTRVEEKYKIDAEYRIEARVTDEAGREIAGHNGFLATYGPFHLEVNAQSYIYKQGEYGQFTVHAIDYDKHPVTTSVHVEISSYRYGGENRVVQSTEVQTGADGFAHFPLRLTEAGSFTVRATAQTSANREVTGTSWVWVAGKNEQTWAEGEARTLQLVADKSSYKVGDVAHVLINGAVENATVLVTTEGSSILTKQLVHASDTNITVDIPITVETQPNIYVAAVFVWNDEVYQGSKSLNVPAVERRLKIDITPAKQQFLPGDPATYNISAKDWTGKPVQAELSVGVVDDAIYAVEPDMAGDIVRAFYGQREPEVQTQTSLEFYFHGEAGKRSIELARVGVGSGSGRHRELAQVKATEFVQPKIRKAFPDTAFWQASIRTDANGQAVAKLSFPDSLTTWRTTVRAIAQDTRSGWAVNRVLVRKNLMVRLAVPRFFRAGDQVTVSAIVHNYLDTAKTARVSLDASGLDIVDGATRDVSVPVRGDVKVDWRVRTAAGTTSAKLLTKALTNEESDAMELTLPVIPFGVKQTINNSGAISEDSSQRSVDLTFPAAIDAASRGIDIELSPSITGAIFGSLEYLTSFPYGCTEQTMSGFLPDVVVASALRDLKIQSTIDPAKLKTQVNAGLQRLYDFQHEDGGWGWWKEDDSMVFMTAYVVAGLSQAQAAGYEIQQTAVDNGKRYLHESLRSHPNMIADLRAYVVYALALAGDRDPKDLNSVWQRKDKLSAEGIAFAGLTMQLSKDGRVGDAAQVLRDMAKAEGDGSYWESKSDNLMEIEVDDSAEATAYAVKLLSQVSPNDPLLPRAVLWLVRHRDEGYYWYSTKQTAMVIYGVVDYLKASKELEPSFTADVLVNGKSVLAHHFTAADVTAVAPVALHLAAADVAGANKIEIRKNGSGRLYWSARGSYFSTDKKLYRSGTFSLNVARDYYKLTSVNNGQKITYNLSALNGPVAGGDVLAVRVTVSGGKWKYLLVEDPIPAGTEFIEHDEFYEVNDKPSWWRNWYSRREFHDNRAAIFQTYFDQQREYFYLLKVVNPGLFQISPASAQPMYQPDVLSTTDPSTLEVK